MTCDGYNKTTPNYDKLCELNRLKSENENELSQIELSWVWLVSQFVQLLINFLTDTLNIITLSLLSLSLCFSHRYRHCHSYCPPFSKWLLFFIIIIICIYRDLAFILSFIISHALFRWRERGGQSGREKSTKDWTLINVRAKNDKHTDRTKSNRTISSLKHFTDDQIIFCGY